jgi:hypothetical protein
VRWIRLRFLLYGVVLAFVSVKLLGGNEDAGGRDLDLEYLHGWAESGEIRLTMSDGRVQEGHVELALPCDAGVQPWRWTMGPATLEQRGNRVSARLLDHSARGERVRWHFSGRLVGRLTDDGNRATGQVHMVLRYTEPDGRTGLCDTEDGAYWEASTR